MTTWDNRIVGHDEVAPDQLVANARNWRRHPNAQRDTLRGSLNELGWVMGVIVNDRTGNLIDGHARVEEALSKGEKTVPVTHVDLSEEQERLALAILDPISAMATADQDALNALIAEVSTSDDALAELLKRLGNVDVDIDDNFEPQEAPGRGLSQLLLLAPTDDVEWARAMLLEYADDNDISGGVDERLGRAAVTLLRADHERRSKHAR